MKWSLAALFVLAVYFGLAWFFFGSSHPCGILEARQKPYVVQRYTENASTLLSKIDKFYMREQELYSKMVMTAPLEMLKEVDAAHKETEKQHDRAIQDLADAPKNAARDLHERIWNQYTPARCFWEALAWNPDPYKASSPLKKMPTGGE